MLRSGEKDPSGYVYRMCTVYYPCNYNYYLISEMLNKQHKKYALKDQIQNPSGAYFLRGQRAKIHAHMKPWRLVACTSTSF